MTTTPGRYNMTCYQGATFSLAPVWKINGQVVNLTDYTAVMQVRTSPDDPTVLVELSTANGRITITGTSGLVSLSLNAATTAALDAGQYVYDLELTAPDSTVTRLLQGGFVVIPQVTQ